MNLIILNGNLTRGIEIKYTNSGTAVAETAIAVTTKRKSGHDETLFIDLTFFGRTAEVANQYLQKGSKVLVEGRLQFSTWKANDGTNRSKHSMLVEKMEMLGSKPQQQQNNNSGNTMQNDDEEIPF